MNSSNNTKRPSFTVSESFVSRCMYCGSTSYGSGCIFSSHKAHIHVDDPTKCIYCGMMAYGSGCIYNPYNKTHVHGMDIGQTVKEQVNKTVELCYITERLFEDITESEAYKLNLVDKNFNLRRTPNTPYEYNLVSPLSKLINRIKKFLPDSNIVVESLKLFSSSKKESVEDYKNKIEFKSEARSIIKNLKNLLKEKSKVLSPELIETALEEAILETINDDKSNILS
jgi:hypothetical protein